MPRPLRVVQLLCANLFLLASCSRAVDLAAEVHAFSEKVAAQKEPESADAAKDSRQTYEARQRQEATLRLLTQLKMLEAYLKRGDYERAQQMIGARDYPGIAPELDEQWSNLAGTLASEIDKQRNEAMQKWYADVDRLVKDVRQACLDAKHSADLDPLLLRCASIQMQRSGQDNVLGQRGSEKLAGVISTLQTWTHFLDQRDAGNATAANETLRNFARDPNKFPVLSAEDIKAQFLPDDSVNVLEAVKKIMGEVKKPEDLTAATDRLKALLADPLKQQSETSSFRQELTKLDSLQAAWKSMQSGDDDGAMRLLDRATQQGGYENLTPYVMPIRNQLVQLILARKVKAITNSEPASGESPPAFLTRVTDELYKQGNYPALTEIMKLNELIDRQSPTTRDIPIIQRFVAAQRLEAAGDALAAIGEYRSVVSSAPAGKYVPSKEAGEALKRLEEKYPEAMKSYDGQVLQEIRALRQQIQSLSGRPFPGRP